MSSFVFTVPFAQPLILGFMGLYFAGVLWVARRFSHRIDSLKDYFLAGRRLRTLPVALTFAASWFGAGSTIASINALNQKGLAGLWDIVFPSLVTCLLISMLFARRVARQNTLSQPEAVEQHYGPLGRLLLSVAILLAVTAFLGSQLVAAGGIFSAVLGLDVRLTTVLITAVIVTYAMLGGYLAVVVTDMLQMGFIALGLLVLLVFCVGQTGGVDGALAAVATQRPQGFWTLGEDWPTHLAMMGSFVMGWVIAPEMWQRMTSAQNEHTAVRSAYGATAILMGLFVMVIGIGLLSVSVVPSQSTTVLVDVAFALENPLLVALVLMGVTSAIGSTMDSSLNVGSLTLTRDIVQGFLRPQATAETLLVVSRLGTVLIAVPAVALALYFQDILHVLWISADIYACTMLVPVVAMLYHATPSRLGGGLAMSLGLLAVVLSALHQYAGFTYWLDAPWATYGGVGLSVLGYGLGMALEKRRLSAETPPALV